MKDLFNKIAQTPVFKLANEWRDTLYYSGGACGIAMVAPPDRMLAYAGYMIAYREVCRMGAWALSVNNFEFVGQRRAPNPSRMVPSSLSATYVGIGISSLGNAQPIYAVFFAMAAHYYFAPKAGGLGHVIKNYRDVMFDYPRKNSDDGGQTQKFLDSLRLHKAQPSFG